MKPINLFAAMLFALVSLSAAHAAGGPIDEEFTELYALSQKAVAAGKEGNAAAFVEAAHAALKQAKDQIERKSDIAMQRIIPNLKTAVREGEAGNLAAGTEAVEAAISKMGKRGSPKFGGGSE
ncbi:MAG TPA: small metal-binding protein SmbP [Methylococcaceae bacterium]|jgi:hypothetical protein|nr:small metal-binding protein SmbP [Methylococcaceae bacterium]